MTEPRRPESWLWILGSAILCLLLSPEPLLLDEETHLYIATYASFERPYDWSMPFPPFHETGFVFAHPPLFHWWLKMVGDSLFTALPWLILWWSGVWKLATHFETSPRWTFGLMLCSAGVVMPLTRTMMPDLMVSALGLYAVSLYLTTENEQTLKIIWSGVLLGLAMWTKYPAIILLFLPMLLEKNETKLVYFTLSAINVLLLGELWVFLEYDQWHLLTVLQESDVVGRGSVGHRVFGIPVRIGLAALPMALVGVRRHPFFPIGVIAVGIYLLDFSLGLWLALGLSSLSLVWKGNRWLVVWIGLVLLGVVVGHNYTAPRYWLVAMAPLAILAVKHLQEWTPSHRWGLIGVSFLLCAVLVYTERFHADQSVQLSNTALAELPVGIPKESLSFSGEWTFRSKMLQEGIKPFDGTQSLVLTAVNSAGWTPHAEEGWTKVTEWVGTEYPLLLSSSKHSVGWYADTLGVNPIQILSTPTPIERVELWKRP